jgi:hypothetical protein
MKAKVQHIKSHPQRVEEVKFRDEAALSILPMLYNELWNNLSRSIPTNWKEQIAEEAYQIADEMLKARRKT